MCNWTNRERSSDEASYRKAGFDVGNVASNVAGGAYGLFVFDTEHTGNASDDTRGHHPATASLAAVFYVPTSMDSTVALTGSPGVVFPAQYHDAAADTYAAGTNLSGGVGILISASSGDYYVKISSSLIANETVRFNFDTNSDRYIRKVFNTNPTLTNTAISATGSRIWGKKSSNRLVLLTRHGILWYF